MGGLTQLVRPGWPEFLGAWEKEVGRVPVTIPGDQLMNINAAFSAWRLDRKRTNESADDWIRRAMQAAVGGGQQMAGYGNLTGPDYLIGAARKRMDDGDAPPFVDAFQDMVTTIVLKGSPMADSDKVVADWPLAPHEAAAIAVFGEATRVAFERRDWESMQEMLGLRLPVILYRVEDGGHTWPGGPEAPPVFGHTNTDVSATDTMWPFFVANPLNQ